jgi:hypothetical protein
MKPKAVILNQNGRKMTHEIRETNVFNNYYSMLTNEQYKSYIGQYVKRFYTPFVKANIFIIKDFRVTKRESMHGHVFNYPEYLYFDGKDEWWCDCEDSVIITNEKPVKVSYNHIKYVANIYEKEYAGYDPFSDKVIISNVLN